MCMKKNLNIRKPPYSECIWSVPWSFIISFVNCLAKFLNICYFRLFCGFRNFRFSLFRRGPFSTSFTFPRHFSCMALQNFVIFVIFEFFSSFRNFRCFVEGLSRPHLHFLVTFRPWPCTISYILVIFPVSSRELIKSRAYLRKMAPFSHLI